MPLLSTTTLRDRTPEFTAIVERLQRSGLASTSNHMASSATTSSPDPKALIQQQSEFARTAADIGQGIHRVSLKLQKLAALAKRTSMFDDPTAEVESLTGIIKQEIQGLNNSIADLERISGKRIAVANKQTLDHSHTVVDDLRSRLKDATCEFKDVLTIRTEHLKHNKERRQMFSSNPDSETVPLMRNRAGSSSMQQHNGSSTAPPPSFLQDSSLHMQAQLAAPQDQYLSSRQEALRNVEKTIVELGGIFQKLSTMVAEQGEVAIRIDDNVGDALGNVSAAQTQLVKYLNNISSNRWLILKVFGVLVTFLILFVMFIV